MLLKISICPLFFPIIKNPPNNVYGVYLLYHMTFLEVSQAPETLNYFHDPIKFNYSIIISDTFLFNYLPYISMTPLLKPF